MSYGPADMFLPLADGGIREVTQSPEGIGEVLDKLYLVLEERKGASPTSSYTAALLSESEDRLLKKIGEEATEVVIAAKAADVEQLRYEIADLLYHLTVTMVRYGLTFDDIAEELIRRRRG